MDKLGLPQYSETLILVPGLGIVNDKPSYTPTIRRTNIPPLSTEKFIINLGWSLPKVQAHHLTNLKAIQDQVKRPILFRFFLGDPYTTELTVFKSILEVLGPDNVEAATRSQAGVSILNFFQYVQHMIIDLNNFLFIYILFLFFIYLFI